MGRLALFTQHETTAALGYDKRRERLEGVQLARGERVQAFGQTAIFYPEFALVGLIVDHPSPAEHELIEEAARSCRELYAAPSFREVAKAARAGLRQGWTLATIVSQVVEQHLDAFIDLHVAIADIESHLAEREIGIEAELGLVLNVAEGRYMIQTLDDETVEVVPVNAPRAKIPEGSWVAKEHIQLGSRAGDFLVPTLGPDELPEALFELSEPRNAKADMRAEVDATLDRMGASLVAENVPGVVVPADGIAKGMLAALAANQISPEMADVWGRGEGRVYEDTEDTWHLTKPDPAAALAHRRRGSRDW